jgi:DNA helicase-2/ATP-dependent DNA helicase PcrA
VLAEFLAHASLEAGDHQADAGSEAVQLMTVRPRAGVRRGLPVRPGGGAVPHENSALESDGLEESGA